MIGRSVSVSFSLTLPNISISLHKSWFMIHKREKWHGNSCKTTIYKWFEFCQNSETTNQNDSRDTKMVRRFAILTNSKCSNFVKLSKRMHIRPHDKSSFEWILSNFIDGPVKSKITKFSELSLFILLYTGPSMNFDKIHSKENFFT